MATLTIKFFAVSKHFYTSHSTNTKELRHVNKNKVEIALFTRRLYSYLTHSHTHKWSWRKWLISLNFQYDISANLKAIAPWIALFFYICNHTEHFFQLLLTNIGTKNSIERFNRMCNKKDGKLWWNFPNICDSTKPMKKKIQNERISECDKNTTCFNHWLAFSLATQFSKAKKTTIRLMKNDTVI